MFGDEHLGVDQAAALGGAQGHQLGNGGRPEELHMRVCSADVRVSYPKIFGTWQI